MASIGSHPPPREDEIEVSLFGPGFGECVVIHVGGNDWIVVDSCKNPETKRAAALDYLDDIGVDVALAVRLIVASHWHDDHIDRLPDLYDRAQNARFACMSAFRFPDFRAILGNVLGVPALAGGSGIDEFCKILHEVQRRRAANILAGFQVSGANTILWEKYPRPSVVVRALSPSVADELAALIRLTGQNVLGVNALKRRVPEIHPNDASIVLSLKIKETLILLGGDLENIANDQRGWRAIVASWNPAAGRHHYFKIPHHGSSNAHCDEVWSDMLISDVFAGLTPFRHLLPTDQDLQRIRKLTRNGFITAPRRVGRFRTRKATVDRIIRGMTRAVWVYPATFGHVRCRCDIASNGKWRYELFGNAAAL
jgi:hypothetical protein